VKATMPRIAGSLMLCGVVLLLPFLVEPQTDVGKNPKDVLNPKTLRQITGQPEPVPGSVERQLAYLAAKQQIILEQLQVVMQLSQQVATNTPRISNLEQRMDGVEASVREHIKAGSSDPSNIAVLQTKVDGIVNSLTWVLAGVGSLMLAAIGVAVKRVVNRNIPPQWAAKESGQQAEYRSAVITKLTEVKSSAEAAYQEANSVNTKLSNIGVEMKDHKPLNPHSNQ